MTKLAALRDLQAELAELKRQYGATANEDWQRRRTAFESVMAIIRFMERMPEWRGLDFGFVDLMEALADIERGRGTPDWLANPVSHRPPYSNRTLIVRACCAGVMGFLMEKGYKEEKAAEFVMRELDAAGVLKAIVAEERNHRKTSWRTIKKWREPFTGKTPDPDREQETEGYQSSLGLLRDAGHAPDRAAKFFLRSLTSEVDGAGKS